MNKVITSSDKQDVDKHPDKDSRRLGGEWTSWDGNLAKDNIFCESSNSIFLIFAFAVITIFNLSMYAIYYLVTPRLEGLNIYLPIIVLSFLFLITIYSLFWYIVVLLTSYTSIKLPYMGKGNRLLVGFLLDMVFKLGGLLNYSRDKLGNSFIKVSNDFVRNTKKCGLRERILLLLPRCLTKDSYKEIKDISKEFKIDMAVCAGGEIARLRVKEYRPTAIIGVACERDLVSGIKDVSGKISVLAIPNIRPDGPCKNTYINFDDLRSYIRFYLAQ